MTYLNRNIAYSLLAEALLGACTETFDATYTTQAEAMQAGAVQAGWVPDWLPSEAREIREVHNIDTNAHMLSAVLPASAALTLPTQCKPAQPSALPNPRFRRTWWPEDVPERGAVVSKYTYWLCEGQVVARAPSLTRVLVWAGE